MNDAISEYQRWKQQGSELRSKAKQAIEARYRELLMEAIQLAGEYKNDFGKALLNPPAVTSFRYKAVSRGGTKVAAKKAVPVDPAVAGLEKRLAAANKKLEAAKAAGSSTKNIEDKIYEIEDAIRLAKTA